MGDGIVIGLAGLLDERNAKESYDNNTNHDEGGMHLLSFSQLQKTTREPKHADNSPHEVGSRGREHSIYT